MTYYFVDSSALVKRYVNEPHDVWVRNITSQSAGHTIIIAYITPVEVMSGVVRHYRDGKISQRTLQATRIMLHRHVNRQYRVILFTDNIIVQAEDLLERYQLRAYDSVQLASALEANRRVVVAAKPPLIFVCGDQRLLTAAAAEGLAVDDPYQHP